MMKKLVLVSIISMVALFGWSCSKDNGPGEFNPNIEISFVNPVDAGVTNSSATPQTKAAGDYDVKLSDVAIFVVAKNGSNSGKVTYKAQFTASELNSKKKVFSANDITTGGASTFDFYAVANAGATFYSGVTLNTTTGVNLKDKIDGAGGGIATLSSYNNVDYAKVVDGTGLRADGMIMAGVHADVTLSTNALTPTKPQIAMNRTVSKVELEAYTTTNTDGSSFTERYPGSAVKVMSAKITKIAPGTTMLDQGSDNYKVPSSSTEWADAAVATVEQISSGSTIVVENKAFNMFYVYPNGGRDASTAIAAYKPALELKTRFYFDAADATADPDNTAKYSEVVYKLPLAGAKGGSSTTDTGDTFGLFKRNGYYKVSVAISGLTETEVVASVSITPWDTVVTQTVNIGN